MSTSNRFALGSGKWVEQVFSEGLPEVFRGALALHKGI